MRRSIANIRSTRRDPLFPIFTHLRSSRNLPTTILSRCETKLSLARKEQSRAGFPPSWPCATILSPSLSFSVYVYLSLTLLLLRSVPLNPVPISHCPRTPQWRRRHAVPRCSRETHLLPVPRLLNHSVRPFATFLVAIKNQRRLNYEGWIPVYTKPTPTPSRSLNPFPRPVGLLYLHNSDPLTLISLSFSLLHAFSECTIPHCSRCEPL